jgi:protease-4
MKNEGQGKNWIFAIGVLVILALFSLFFALVLGSLFVPSEPLSLSGNVARIYVTGEILPDGSSSIFGSSGASSQDIVDLIKKADENKEIKALLIEINSPGGAAVASEDIVKAIKKSKKPSVALIKDTGASGAYWVASATDVIVADPISITGSIGVLSSYLEFSGLMNKYGVGYERIVGGEYKDIGTPFRNLTDEERQLLQEQIDVVYDYFVKEVAANRNMSEEQMKGIATGMIYTGIRAKQLGLVDVLGGEDEAEEAIKQKANLTEVNIVDYKKKRTLLDVLTETLSRQSYTVGQGIGDSLVSKADQNLGVRT